MNEIERVANLSWLKIPDRLWADAMKVMCLNCGRNRGHHQSTDDDDDNILCKEGEESLFSTIRDPSHQEREQSHQSWLEIQEMTL